MFNSYTVRKVCGYEIVQHHRERTCAVFKDGSCVESGFPNLNTARLWCIERASSK